MCAPDVHVHLELPTQPCPSTDCAGQKAASQAHNLTHSLPVHTALVSSTFMIHAVTHAMSGGSAGM